MHVQQQMRGKAITVHALTYTSILLAPSMHKSKAHSLSPFKVEKPASPCTSLFARHAWRRHAAAAATAASTRSVRFHLLHPDEVRVDGGGTGNHTSRWCGPVNRWIWCKLLMQAPLLMHASSVTGQACARPPYVPPHSIFLKPCRWEVVSLSGHIMLADEMSSHIWR